MSIYFNRMYARPQEDLNDVISDEVVARNPPRFTHLIGRNNPYSAKDFKDYIAGSLEMNDTNGSGVNPSYTHFSL